ncbi:MAG: DNA-directed RNA polymerase subunit delta [Erysipelotrichaceae bacterium]|nr:DNA-directed RNA polymerase subunit delta [Erysipelotrichaceae bacterium]
MTAAKTMTDIAYEVMSKKKRSVPFIKLWDEVSKILGASSDRIAQFYSDLSLDPRFVNLGENKWDLKERRKYVESHVDIEELEITDDDDDEFNGEDESDDSNKDSDDY